MKVIGGNIMEKINLSKKTLTNMCEAFCTEIEKAGYWAGIYANKYFFTTYLDYKKLEEKLGLSPYSRAFNTKFAITDKSGARLTKSKIFRLTENEIK